MLKQQTIIFFLFVALLITNLALSLSLTFAVPVNTPNPLNYMVEELKPQLSVFIATGLAVIVLDLFLLIYYPEPISLLPPFTLGSIFGFLAPILFVSLYFVRRSYSAGGGTFDFFDIIPLTFITVIFYTGMAIINAIAENIKAAKSGRITP